MINPTLKTFVVLALLIPSGSCSEDGPYVPNAPPPTEIIPQIGEITGNLRCAKDTCEDRGSIAKQDVRFRRLREGRDLYNDARAAHNKVLSRTIAALGLPEGGLTKEELTRLLKAADDTRDAFLDWYDRAVKRRELPDRAGVVMCTKAAGVSVDLADLILDSLIELVKLGDQRAREQREWIRHELEKCEWEPWTSLPGDR